MNNRILKKLSNRIKNLVESNPHIQNKFWRTNDVWLDNDEPVCGEYLNLRHPYANRVSGLWVLGGEADYWGEATEIHPLFRLAQEVVYWEFGKPVTREVKDAEGSVVDEMPDWPIYKRRLTGAKVIHLINKMVKACPEKSR